MANYFRFDNRLETERVYIVVAMARIVSLVGDVHLFDYQLMVEFWRICVRDSFSLDDEAGGGVGFSLSFLIFLVKEDKNLPF